MEGSRDYSDGCRRLRELLPPQAITEEGLGQALDFLNEVKLRLHAKPEDYRDFCSVLEKLADPPFKLIPSSALDFPKLQPQHLLWNLRNILDDGKQDLMAKFNSYLPLNLRVSVPRPPAAAAVAVGLGPATVEARVPTTAPAAIDTPIPCQRIQPDVFDQASKVDSFPPVVAGAEPPQPAIPLFPKEEGTHYRKQNNNTTTSKAGRVAVEADGKFLPVAAGAEPLQPEIPLFLSGGGLARKEEGTHNRKQNNNTTTSKAGRVAVEADGKFLPVVAGGEPLQPQIPLFPSGSGLARREEATHNRKQKNNTTSKAAGVAVEADEFTCVMRRCLNIVQVKQIETLTSQRYEELLPKLYLCSFGRTQSVTAEEGRGARPEVEKRPRPDEAEEKCRKRRRITPDSEKEKPKAAMTEGVEAADEPEVTREEEEEELKECLLLAAHYINERMNDDGEGGGKGRIHLLRSVEAMYGDKGREMVEIVEAEPEKLLPIVQKRLYQKIGELELATHKEEVYPMATR